MITPEYIYYLKAPSKAEKVKWMAYIQESIDEKSKLKSVLLRLLIEENQSLPSFKFVFENRITYDGTWKDARVNLDINLNSASRKRINEVPQWQCL